MTDFESASLLYAKLTAFGGIGLVAVSIAAVYVARGQLKQLVQQVKDGQENIRSVADQVEAAVEANKIGRLESLLTLEGTIAERRLALGEAGIKLSQLIEEKKSGKEIVDYQIEGAKLHFNETAEMYLNALDRLCSCFLNGQLSEEELRADYRDLINNAVKKDFPEKMAVGTNHRNIVKVYERWASK